MSREFERYFKNTLNRHECLLNGEKVTLVFQDHSQSNNKDLSDDKYVIAPNSIPIKTGDYIEWSNSWWMIFTEEFKTIQTHQQAKMKEANKIIKWIVDGDGNISNGGKGWPAYAISQTLYTMGVNVTTYIPVVDSKVMLFLQDNEESRSIKMGRRLFVGGRVYETQYINSFSRPGVISFLLDEVAIGPYDNIELGIADYYSEVELKEEDKSSTSNYLIMGELNPRISRTYRYEPEGFSATEWLLDHTSNESPAHINGFDESGVQLKFKDDNRFVGETVTVIARAEDGTYVSKNIVVALKF